ncbi:MAG: class I SAM-dependent methyltransferase [Caldilineaceae bacterium]
MNPALLHDLQTAYDKMVMAREGKTFYSWKAAERARFLAMVQTEGKATVLEIGAGTGRDSLFFQEQGMAVSCVDLSPAMVERCRSKGLDAHIVGFAELDHHFAADRFDAVYAVNCLLHVPKPDLKPILRKIWTILAPGGLFYWGQYGGVDQEGVWEGDNYSPKRFFARYTDEQFQALPHGIFTTEAFCVIPKSEESHFHSLILRK